MFHFYSPRPVPAWDLVRPISLFNSTDFKILKKSDIDRLTGLMKTLRGSTAGDTQQALSMGYAASGPSRGFTGLSFRPKPNDQQ